MIIFVGERCRHYDTCCEPEAAYTACGCNTAAWETRHNSCFQSRYKVNVICENRNLCPVLSPPLYGHVHQKTWLHLNSDALRATVTCLVPWASKSFVLSSVSQCTWSQSLTESLATLGR
ncbi:hypothetical protein TRVL_08580 [Trypanosoma vivax]|nr:hypothetical protein TRVL_08580 [Trypanosoma vivax]